MRINLWKLKNLTHRLRGIKQEVAAVAKLGIRSELRIKVLRANGAVEDLGLVSRRIVTTAGLSYVVDAFQGLANISTFVWHDCGLDNTAESASDVGLLNPYGGGRVTGAQSEPTAVTYRTTATITFSAPFTIVEHGLFSNSTGSTLFDRSIFAGILVVAGDGIIFEYTLTAAGS